MGPDLQALADTVTAATSAEAAAKAALLGFAQQVADLAANGGTPAQFQALAAQLKSATDDMVTAIPTNTPVAPAAFKAKK